MCAKYGRHCLYEKEERTPLTRKHLTQVEEELRLARALLSRQIPGVDLTRMLEQVRNGEGLDGLVSGPNELAKIREFVTPSDIVYQIPQLIPLHQVRPSGNDPGESQSPDSPLELQHHQQPGIMNYDWDEREGKKRHDGLGGITSEKGGTGYLGAASSGAMLKFVQGRLVDDIDRTAAELSNQHPVEILEQPRDRDISNQLVESYIIKYFETYHISYPIVHQALFMAQLQGVVAPPENGWEVLKYMIAAIGAFMSAKSNAEDDDLVLFRKAKSLLSMDILETGNITLVQALALISNYLQKRDRPNSGYNYLGLAVRMSLGLGLHKECPDLKVGLLNKEMRRRTWWCLYIFDCGQTITYGRPLGIPCAGVDVRLPLNVFDSDITASSKDQPEQECPTVYTSVKLQSQFHLLTNSIYERIISEPFPSAHDLLEWDQRYVQRWLDLIPSYFHEHQKIDRRFERAHRVLFWRFRNLRIIMFRSFLLKNAVFISRGRNDYEAEQESETQGGRICLTECHNTLTSMNEYWSGGDHNRMDAWYTLYFLVPAAVMPLVCLRNNPMAVDAPTWRADVQLALNITERILPIYPAASSICDFINSLSAGFLTELSDPSLSPTDQSPQQQIEQLHSMLWPFSFDIEQQLL